MPLISSRRPWPAANSSMASAMREAPPVRATMPSASRLSWTSRAGTRQTNQAKPPASASAVKAPSKSPDLPSHRSKRQGASPSPGRGVILPSSQSVSAVIRVFQLADREHRSRRAGGKMRPRVAKLISRLRHRPHKAGPRDLLNRFDGAADGAAAGNGRRPGDQADLRKHGQVTESPERECSEHSRKLIACGRS
jgi:hypothetical protein